MSWLLPASTRRIHRLFTIRVSLVVVLMVTTSILILYGSNNNNNRDMEGVKHDPLGKDSRWWLKSATNEDNANNDDDLASRLRDLEEENSILKRQLGLSSSEVGNNRHLNEQKSSSQHDIDISDNLYSSSSSSSSSSCPVIHVAIVCAGFNSSRSVVTVVKSILFYRTSSVIHFHFLVDAISKNILNTLFKTWDLSSVNVSFYLTNEVSRLVSWIPNRHYSGIYGLMKLTLDVALPSTLDRVIVLDTDITLTTDIFQLWDMFEVMRATSSTASIGLVENQSDWYLGKIWKNHHPWPALGRGFNTGVMMLDLRRLRSLNWSVMWTTIARRHLKSLGATSLADQDVFNAVIKEYPSLVFQLPCEWNVQLSDNTLSESLCFNHVDGPRPADLKVIHWNSPNKLKVKNKHLEYFRNLYLTFTQFDGNLLRRELITCAKDTAHPQDGPGLVDNGRGQRVMNESQSSSTNNSSTIEDDSCFEFRKGKVSKYRTHLYYLDYNYEPSTDGNDVTLVAQLSMDRLQMIDPLCMHWDGPVSLALYVSDFEVDQLISYVSESDTLRDRKNIAYHIVYKDGSYYPINYLRNVALDQVTTPYVFLTDVDFLPMYNLYEYLRKTISTMSGPVGVLGPPSKLALVVPAFETQRYRISFPRNKQDLMNQLDDGDLFTFRYHVWTRGHSPTDYGKWRNATLPYRIHWEPDFEPYIVVRKDIPPYDPRFVGFGWNKVSHIMELYAANYDFVVLPNAFIIHMPHAPSFDIARFRSSPMYRNCLKLMKNEFVNELSAKYGRRLSGGGGDVMKQIK